VTSWPSTRARRVLAALLRAGWSIKRDRGGSHRVLEKPGWPDYVFAFRDSDEIGPRMLERIARHTGLTPEEL
jgi:predicted RNA binding protein YcfA (HicA-like mRNA interferase family)